MAIAYRATSPTGSYLVDVPSGAHEEVDDRVVSFWMPDDEILLQLSSYRREEGDQVLASERLHARLARDELKGVASESVALSRCFDVAAAIGEDAEGTCWLYCYAVWEDLALFATVSAPTFEVLRNSWGMEALCSLRRASSAMPGPSDAF